MKKRLIILLFSLLLISNNIFGDVSSGDLFDFSLEELMELEITTAGKKPEKVRDIPASVVIVSREDIELYGYTSLPEILENVAGMYGINDYNYHFFGVRGFWSGEGKNIIYLVNGEDQKRGHMLHYNFRAFPVPAESISRIEIIRGPMSVIYGSGAFFGAINIITDEKYGDDTDGQIVGSIGSFDTRRAVISLAGGDDVEYSFSASTLHSDGIDAPYSKMTANPYELPGINETNSNTKGRLETNNKYFNLSAKYKGFDFNIAHTLYNDETYFSFPPVDEGSMEATHDTHVKGRYSYCATDNLDFRISASSYQSHIDFHWDQISQDYFGNQVFRMQRWGLELLADYRPMPGLQITGGYVNTTYSDLSSLLILSSDGLLIDYGMNPEEKSSINAVYAQVDYFPINNLHLVGGLRAEKAEKYNMFLTTDPGMESESTRNTRFSHDEIELIPRFAAIYNLSDKNVFKFLYGKAINQSSFFTMAVQMFGGDYSTPKPEIIETLELNYLSFPVDNFSINASLFYNTFYHLLVRELQPGDIGGRYSNAGKMETIGTELTLKTNPVKNVNFELSGIWQNSEDKRKGFGSRDVAYSPKFLGYFKLSANPVEHLTAAITGNYVGSMESHWDVEKENSDGSMGGRIGDKSDAYFQASINLRYTGLLLDGSFLSLHVSNLLDAEYLYPVYTNNAYFEKGTLGPGRSITFKVGYKF